MQSPSNQSSCCPSIRNSAAFDLCSSSLSCTDDSFYVFEEESFAPALGYITPRTKSPRFASPSSPPRFILPNPRSTAICLSDLDESLSSELYLPQKLDEDHDSVSTTRLLPRFVSFSAVDATNAFHHDHDAFLEEDEEEIHQERELLEHHSMPTLESLTSDTADNTAEEGPVSEQDEARDDVNAAMQSAPPMPQFKKVSQLATNARPLNLQAVRRKSFGAFAA